MKRFLVTSGLTLLGGLSGTGISAFITVSVHLVGGNHFVMYGFPLWYLNFHVIDFGPSGFYFNFTNAFLDFIVWSFVSLFLILAFSKLGSYMRKRRTREEERTQPIIH
jgi:hypothetical protein